MWLDQVLRAVVPVVAMAFAENGKWHVDGNCTFSDKKGAPLSELDLTLDPPSELVVLGGANVTIIEGEAFSVALDEGDQANELLRFWRDGEVLAIFLKDSTEEGSAKIIVTMPAPRKLTMAGSGELNCGALAAKAKIVLAGSGSIVLDHLESKALKVVVAGSGRVRASGKVKKLALTLAGSGIAEMDALSAKIARVEIAGSGTAQFTSDGEVDARIMGSGIVRVHGSARCTVQSFGSGQLICEREAKAA